MSERRVRGPRVDVHAHPGRCFLAGASPIGGPGDDVLTAQEIRGAGMAAVSYSTVADLAVLGFRDGGLGAVRAFEPGEAVADHLRQLAVIRDIGRRNDLPLVRQADDITAAHASGRTALLLTCEGADFAEDRADLVDEAFEAGVRAITIVHYRQNAFGDLQTEPELHGGLSEAGRELVRRMNRLGMIVDLAHATERTTRDAVEVSSHPVMISHTHLRHGDNDHPRLVSTEHARIVAAAGGLVGAWPSGVRSATLDDFIDEVVRLVDAIGAEHVAIGTDMDANFQPVLTRYGQFDDLENGLAAGGLAEHDINLVLGTNAVNLVRRVCG